jgi:hypothetical protein
MELSFGLSQRQGRKRKKEYETLGKIVDNLYSFIESGLDRDLKIYDDINMEMVPAKDYFEERRGMFVVNNERLPFDFDVKGAYIKKSGKVANQPILELSKLDFPKVEKAFLEDFGDEVVLNRKSICDDYGTDLVKVVSANRYEWDKLIRRSTLKLIPSYYDDFGLAINAVDSIYNHSAFKVDEELENQVASIVGPPNQKQELVMKPELRQLMKLEQTIKGRPSLNQYQIMNSQVLAMSVEEIQNRLRDLDDELRDQVLPTLYPVIKRKIISNIRKAKPNFSWKQAEKMYDCLVSKGN